MNENEKEKDFTLVFNFPVFAQELCAVSSRGLV